MRVVFRGELLRRTSLFLTVALTALDVSYALPVNGTYRRLSGIEYARAHRKVVKVAGPTAPIFAVPLVITNVLLLSKTHGGNGFGWISSSLLFLLTNAGITFAVNVPINNRFTRAPDESPPEDWEKLRDRWLVAHNVRTIAQVVGLFMLLAGLTKTERN